MMKYILIFVCCIFNICKAQKNDNFEQWIQLSDRQCKVNKYERMINNNNSLAFRKLFINDSDTCLLLNFNHSNLLYLLRVNDKSIDSIKLPFKNIHDIHAVDYINNDSILVFFSKWDSFGYDKYYLLSINKKGEILKTYSTINNLNGKDYFITYVNNNTVLFNNKLTFIYLPRNRKQMSNKKFIFIYDLKKDSSYYLPIIYLQIDDKIYAEYLYPYFLWIDENNLLISYRFKSNMLKYNLKDNKITTIKTPMNEIDTNILYSPERSTINEIYSIIFPIQKLNIFR